MFALPKIYPITDTRIANLSHAEQCKKLIIGGASLIQIREKYALTDEFYNAANEVIKIAQQQDIKVLINDRVDIAVAVEADGVHLGQDDLPPLQAREILGDDAIIGFSSHSVKQAMEASKLPIDYIAIGPVFSTTTKENPDESVGLDGVKKVRGVIGDFPLVAIGGINLQNYQQVLKAGADSVAIVSEILKLPERITQNFRVFNE